MAVSELEDLGLYSQTEAARYSRIPLSTVHRWFARRYGVVRGELISFDEFVSLLFVRELRDRWRVPLREILEAERDLRERTGEAHPFAYEALWVAGRDVLIRVRADSEGFMSANRRGQLRAQSRRPWSRAKLTQPGEAAEMLTLSRRDPAPSTTAREHDRARAS